MSNNRRSGNEKKADLRDERTILIMSSRKNMSLRSIASKIGVFKKYDSQKRFKK